MTSTSTDWVSTPYKWASGTVPVTTEITSDSGSFTKLLESKVKKATEEMQRDLEGQLLYGSDTVRRSAKEAEIRGSAPVFTAEMLDAYKKKMTENIFRESPIMEALKMKTRKADMNEAVTKAMAKRAEVRAEAVLTFLDEHWGDPEPGETHGWSATFTDTPDKEYFYTAVLGHDHRWYVSRDERAYTHESLKAHIADICLRGEVYFNGELVA